MYLTSNPEQQVKIGEWKGTEEREEEDKRLMSPGWPLTLWNVNRKSPKAGILDLKKWSSNFYLGDLDKIS